MRSISSQSLNHLPTRRPVRPGASLPTLPTLLLLLGFAGDCLAGWSVKLDSLKDILIPVYSQDVLSAVATVRIERVLKDYQRKGFFRIGLLPVIVGEGVRIELADQERFWQAVETATKWLGSRDETSAVELRRVSFYKAGYGQPVLRAGRLQFLGKDRFALTEGIVISNGVSEIRVDKVLLELVPGAGGILSWGQTNQVNLRVCFASADQAEQKGK